MSTAFWTIKNFEFCPNHWGMPLKSPVFTLHGSKYRLKLNITEINQDTSKDVTLILRDFQKRVVDESFISELGIVTSEGTRVSHKRLRNILNGIGKDSPSLNSREKLSKEKDLLLADGNLTFFCKITRKHNSSHLIGSPRNRILTDDTLTVCSEIKRKQPRKQPPAGRTKLVRVRIEDEDLTKLSDAFEKLYESELFSDMDLITNDGTFKIHKAILHARFPELLKDADSVENIGTPTMNVLLRYLYSGKLNRSRLNLFEIAKSSCKISPRMKLFPVSQSTTVHVTTSLKKKIFCFTWNILNFRTMEADVTILNSLIGDEDCPWTWFNFFLSKNEESFMLTIKRYSNKCKRIICKVLNDGSKTYEHTFEKEDSWTLPPLVIGEISKLDDEISFPVEIAVTDGSVTNEREKIECAPRIDSVDEEQTRNDLEIFQNDLAGLLNDSKYSDVTLEAGDGKFHAHKFVLCARSMVFSEMFQNESPESDIVVIESELDSRVVKNMLSYMYCGDMGVKYASTGHVTGMYTAACKYGIPDLKVKCVNILESTLSLKNAGEILAMAHEHDDKGLEERVYDFMLSHPKEFTSSKQLITSLVNAHHPVFDMFLPTV